MPAIKRSFSLIIVPSLLNFSYSKAACLAEALSKEQTVRAERTFSAISRLRAFPCFSNSYSVMVVVLIVPFFVSDCIDETIFSSPARKSIMTLVSMKVNFSLQWSPIVGFSFFGNFGF